MMTERRVPRTPLPDEYSRVTNAERFRPLHAHALDLLVCLEAAYDVVRSDAFTLVPGLVQPFEHARAPVALTPVVPDAAPIAIAFTAFPSVIVRYGRWHAASFPACGCDACAESAAGEAERLDALVERVVGGGLREAIRVPLLGAARLVHALGDVGPHSGSGGGEGWMVIPRALARQLAAGAPRLVRWVPWPRRHPRTRRAADR